MGMPNSIVLVIRLYNAEYSGFALVWHHRLSLFSKHSYKPLHSLHFARTSMLLADRGLLDPLEAL